MTAFTYGAVNFMTQEAVSRILTDRAIDVLTVNDPLAKLGIVFVRSMVGFYAGIVCTNCLVPLNEANLKLSDALKWTCGSMALQVALKMSID